MSRTQEFMVSCGTAKVPANLPVERTRILPGPPPSQTPLPDAADRLRQALANPVGLPALEKLVGKGSKVTIGIQDGRATHYLPEDQDLRILGLPILMELLEQYGVRPENIHVRVANALRSIFELLSDRHRGKNPSENLVAENTDDVVAKALRQLQALKQAPDAQ